MKKILMVDDEKQITSIFSRYLQRHGYEVEATNDPLEVLGFDSAKLQEFCCLMTDFKMPQLNGLELVKEVKSRKFSGDIIIFSGFLTHVEVEYFEELDVDLILHKPLAPSSMIKILESMKHCQLYCN